MTQTVLDQMRRSLEVPTKPMRIVSLVPSQTELLYHLGLGETVVGITKFCIHPNEWFRDKARIGGTKKINFDAVKALNPDLILGNKEENDKQDIEKLSNSYPVWMSDIFNLEDAINMIQSIAVLTSTEAKAIGLIDQIKAGFSELKTTSLCKPRVIYLIWKKPYIAAGRNTFINEMIEKAGFENCIENPESRYPELDIESIAHHRPDYIFLSSEPFPFKKEHCEEIDKQAPNSHSILVDGEMFSWYGSRLILAYDYFNNLHRTIERISKAN